MLQDGEDIDYDGASGPIEMDEAGDPQTATFQIREYTGDEFTELAETKEASVGG